MPIKERAITFDDSQRQRCLALAQRSARIREHGYFVRTATASASAAQLVTKKNSAQMHNELKALLALERQVPRPYLLIDAAKHCRILAKNNQH